MLRKPSKIGWGWLARYHHREGPGTQVYQKKVAMLTCVSDAASGDCSPEVVEAWTSRKKACSNGAEPT